MNETADIVSNLPAIIVLSFWWALLSMMDLLSADRPEGRPGPDADRQVGKTRATADDERFPALREIDPGFSSEAFLAGACRVYEEVLRAYVLWDAQALRALLSEDVCRAFDDACAARRTNGETLELTFVGMQSATIADVEIGPETLEIAVHFRAHVIQTETASTGEIIHGNPAAVTTTSDLWTFSRALPVKGVAWTVVETAEAP